VATPAAGGDCLLAGRASGLFVVDMSSSAPADTLALHARLRGVGGRLVDAPVSGGVARAVEADLTVMAGGDPADVDACEPVLQAVARRVFRTGGVGSGHAMKALNNLLSATNLAAAVEVVLLGRRAGLDPATMLEVLNESTGRSNATDLKLPRYILPGTFDSGFSLDLMVKDLGIALGIASSHGLHAPVAEEAVAVWRDAAAELGAGRDHTEIARFVQSAMGVALEG
jgi:3-hydroxyisobutyrate dehydrogenase